MEKGHVKLTIHLSAGAQKKLSEEETQMLVKWCWEEMEKRKGEGHNLFRFPKLGICIVRDSNELVLMTDDEHRAALGKHG